jgi:GAF domain-containing protein/HAMP domain-containing protein
MRSERRLGSLFTRLSLRSRLYIGLGALVVGLVITGGAGVLSSLVTQNMINRFLAQHQRLTDITLQIERGLLQIHNEGTAFYDRWQDASLPGTLRSARLAAEQAGDTVGSLQLQLVHVSNQASRMLQLEQDPNARADVDRLLAGLGWYETSLLQMTDLMDQLWTRDSGELHELNALLENLRSAFADPALAPLQVTVWQIQQNQRDFLTLHDITYSTGVEESVGQLRHQLATVDSANLPNQDPSAIGELVDEYERHFRVVSSLALNLQETRALLANQLDLGETMIGNLDQQHRLRLEEDLETLARVGRLTTAVIVAMSLVILTGAVAVAATTAGQVIRPIQALGETASQLGAGNLTVRAPVTGQDEISQTSRAFNMMADRLRELLTGLEQAVAERTQTLERQTADLEEANRRQMEVNRLLEQTVELSQRRAALLHASSQVSRVISRLHDLDELLPALASLISEHFDVYHVGIFLLDETRRWAVLRASNSPGGQRMVSRNHKLAVGAEGIVGSVTATGEPRIALDVDVDAAHLATPELPDTRSEIAIPLSIDEEVIGALDVQSLTPSAFGTEDLAALSGLAEQITIALQNARLFQQTQAAIARAESAQERYLEKVWSEYVRLEPVTGYEYTATSMQPFDDRQTPPELDLAVKHRVPVSNRSNGHEEAESVLAAPIVFRNQVIGAIGLQESGIERQWGPDEIALLQEVAAQLGLALENARLFQQTERRAQREAMVSQIVARIRQKSDVEGIMQTAVRELGKALRSPHTYIRLATSLETQTLDKGDGHEN